MSAFCVWITPIQCQFFYSHYTPLNTQFSPIFSQTFLPTLPAASPLAYTRSSVTYNIPNVPTAEYRGFGYRTDFKDGASATVFYVTGPEAQNLRSFSNFPSFTRKFEQPMPGRARSLASDLTDLNAVPNAHEKIQNILNPAEFDKLFDAATPGVINFYSFPAGTVPLALARQVGNTTTTNVTTTTTTPSSKDDEKIAAESVVNPKIIINAVENMIKSNGTTTENTETTESSSQKASTETSTEVKPTEAKSEETTTFLVMVEDEEATTTSSNEETTTQV